MVVERVVKGPAVWLAVHFVAVAVWYVCAQYPESVLNRWRILIGAAAGAVMTAPSTVNGAARAGSAAAAPALVLGNFGGLGFVLWLVQFLFEDDGQLSLAAFEGEGTRGERS